MLGTAAPRRRRLNRTRALAEGWISVAKPRTRGRVRSRLRSARGVLRQGEPRQEMAAHDVRPRVLPGRLPARAAEGSPLVRIGFEALEGADEFFGVVRLQHDRVRALRRVLLARRAGAGQAF